MSFKLPKLEEPARYQGLYTFDFGDYVSVGYTLAEIAILLQSERYRHGKVYKIVRVDPDGQISLKGVASHLFQLETGMFFCSTTRNQASADYADLARLAKAHRFPCQAKLH